MPAQPPSKRLSRHDMIEMLEEIACDRDESATPRIQAIKALVQLKSDQPDAEKQGFDALDEVSERRKKRASK